MTQPEVTLCLCYQDYIKINAIIYIYIYISVQIADPFPFMQEKCPIISRYDRYAPSMKRKI